MLCLLGAKEASFACSGLRGSEFLFSVLWRGGSAGNPCWTCRVELAGMRYSMDLPPGSTVTPGRCGAHAELCSPDPSVLSSSSFPGLGVANPMHLFGQGAGHLPKPGCLKASSLLCGATVSAVSRDLWKSVVPSHPCLGQRPGTRACDLDDGTECWTGHTCWA